MWFATSIVILIILSIALAVYFSIQSKGKSILLTQYPIIYVRFDNVILGQVFHYHYNLHFNYVYKKINWAFKMGRP